MDKPITIRAAKARLPELIRRAEAGEEIVVARRNKPVVRLVPIAAPPKLPRRPGRLKGKIGLDEAFWDPLDLVPVAPARTPKRQFGGLKDVASFDESFRDPLRDDFLSPFKGKA